MRPSLLFLALGVLACARADAPADPAPATPNVVTIAASDFAFAAPDTIPSGMTAFHLMATSGLHHALVVQLTEGRTFADLTSALSTMKPSDPFPSWMVFIGGPNPPAPGDTAIATHDLAPGNYALLCMVDVPDRVPHAAKGMIRPLVVVPATAPSAPAPASAITMDLVDFGFDLSAPLTAGEHVIKVTNSAQQPHEFALVRLDEGKTMADLGAWAATLAGAMPAKPLGGLAPMAPGGTGYIRVQLVPGNYALLCFLPDATDGKLHLEHGMVREFTIS